jgi:hypothetical protein
MDRDDLVITGLCLLDEGLAAVWPGRRRERGPAATLSDSAVLTREGIGEDLGWEQDAAICTSFRRHWRHFCPALARLHRSPLVRQAAHRPIRKDRVWQGVGEQVPHDPPRAIRDSLARLIGPFTRAARSRWCKARPRTGMIS